MNITEIMKRYVPNYLLTATEYKSVIESDGAEIEKLRQDIDSTLEQFFVPTATWGLDKWEKFLGLEIHTGKPIEHRRSRIISKMRGLGTVTVEMMKNVAEAYDGGTVDVTEQAPLYQFTVEFIDTRGIPPNLDDLKAAIEEIKPAHLAVAYKFRYLIWDDLDLENLTWDNLDAMNIAWADFEAGGWLNA